MARREPGLLPGGYLKRKPIHFYCETWMQSFWIMESWDWNAAKKWLMKWDSQIQDMPFYQGKTIFREDGTGPIMIWTQPSTTLAKRMSILAHECIHAAHMTLKRAGVRPCFDNDEAVTYLVTVLMRKALRAKR